jgi:hypothetical protein
MFGKVRLPDSLKLSLGYLCDKIFKLVVIDLAFRQAQAPGREGSVRGNRVATADGDLPDRTAITCLDIGGSTTDRALLVGVTEIFHGTQRSFV